MAFYSVSPALMSATTLLQLQSQERHTIMGKGSFFYSSVFERRDLNSNTSPRSYLENVAPERKVSFPKYLHSGERLKH